MLGHRSFEFGLLAVGLVAPLAATACADDGVSLHVECNVAPEISEDACVWSPDSDVCVFDGRLNLRAASSYVAAFRVNNGLKSRVSASPPRAEPNGIQLSGANVELRTPDGNPLRLEGLSNPYKLVATGYADPGGSTVLQVELLPPAYVDVLREQAGSKNAIDQVVAMITVRGSTDGQTSVKSSPFTWPIRLLSASPVVEDGECTMVDKTCEPVQGMDAFANVCLCNRTDVESCDLGPKP